jgi:hypothetical protein
VLGLTPATGYQFQLVAFRGTLNVNAVFGALSNGASGTTAIAVTVLPPPPLGGTWPNEPAGFTLVNDYDLGRDPIPATYNAIYLGLSGWDVQWNPVGNGSAIADGGAPFSPPAVYQVRYPAGFAGGSAPSTLALTFPGRSELYFGYWWKPSTPWQGHSSGINKISFCIAGNFSNDIIVSMRAIPGAGSGPPFHVQLYVNGTYLTNNVNDPTVTLGAWHRIEVYLNEATNAARLWLDGVPLSDHTSVGLVAVPFDLFELSPTWGGIGDTKTETDYYWYDHVHLSGQ